MRVIKSIHNNAAICADGKGHELIALGIGFGTIPREILLPDIKRTFYGIDPKSLGLVSKLSEDVLEFAAQLADLARTISPNLPVTLADYIAFAIKRTRGHMVVEIPLAYDVQQSYPTEYRIKEMAVHGISRTFNVRLPKTEAVGIALSIVSCAIFASAHDTERQKMTERLIEDSTKIVEGKLHITVGRNSFDYARFATHMRYLIGRLILGEYVSSDTAALLPELEEGYPYVSACGHAVADFLEKSLDAKLDEEERVYLILHVNRVFERETSGQA
jgi:beta-glucoside operon transcriptional antiterminator